MLLSLLLVLTAQAADVAPATITGEGVELISERRDVETLREQVEPLMGALGECRKHTGGLNYGNLTLNFMVDKRGKGANASIRSGYVVPKALSECLTSVVDDIDLGRGDIAVAKVTVAL